MYARTRAREDFDFGGWGSRFQEAQRPRPSHVAQSGVRANGVGLLGVEVEGQSRVVVPGLDIGVIPRLGGVRGDWP